MKICMGITAYQRPYYLRETLASWRIAFDQLALSRPDVEIHTRVFIDPHDNGSITEELKRVTLEAGFDYHLNDHRYGVLCNSHHVFETYFEHFAADYVILAEEDFVVSSNALEYQVWSAELIINELPGHRIVGAACHVPADRDPYSDSPNNVAELQRFTTQVWGAQKEFWSLLNATWDKDYSSGHGSQSGWDWNLSLRVLPHYNLRFLFPGWSLSNHIGEFEGIHTTPADYPGSRSPSFEPVHPTAPFQVVEWFPR